jgi:hypothetical protein
MITEDDKLALLALLTRYNRTWLARDRDMKARAEIEARLQQYSKQMERLVAAFSVFDFGTTKEEWLRLKEVVGVEAFNRAVAKGERDPQPDEDEEREIKTIEAEIIEHRPDVSIRDIVLERLRLAGSDGVKASEITAHLNSVRPQKVHEKTSGMTLYRLSQDGLARREGRTWFFVPQAETKNPGAPAPGQINGLTRKE